MRAALTFLLFGAALLASPAQAQNLTIPGHVETGFKQEMPKRGVNMDAVLAEFGQPDQIFGPVGEPPITEWVYGSFRVYFEYQRVLHTIDLDTLIMPQQQ